MDGERELLIGENAVLRGGLDRAQRALQIAWRWMPDGTPMGDRVPQLVEDRRFVAHTLDEFGIPTDPDWNLRPFDE